MRIFELFFGLGIPIIIIGYILFKIATGETTRDLGLARIIRARPWESCSMKAFLILNVEAMPATNIHNCIRAAKSTAFKTGCMVRFEFNEITVHVTEWCDVQQVYKRWHNSFHKVTKRSDTTEKWETEL